MIGETNTGSGNNSRNVFAFIAVTYPSDTVCTCRNGHKRFRAPRKANGYFVFTVPYAGDWTITCSDKDTIETIDISITYHGQSEKTVFAPRLLLFSNGDLYSPLSHLSYMSSSITDDDKLYASISGNYGSAFYMTNKIDVTNYSKLVLDLNDRYSWNSLGVRFGFSNSVPNVNYSAGTDSTSWAAVTTISSSETVPGIFTVDLSKATGSLYFSMVFSSTGDRNGFVSINKIYLQK